MSIESTKSETRFNPVILGNWVIISGGRRNRPDDFLQGNERKDLPPYDENCYFCPGNEGKTPPEVLAYRNGNVWWTRVVPNKFPALSLDIIIDREQPLIEEGIFAKIPGYGIHEVIIETPSHNQDIYDRPFDLVREMVWMYKDRLIASKSQEGIRDILIFKNKGSTAGASLEHPHSQLIASPLPMLRLYLETEGALRYFSLENYMSKKGQCGYCDMISQELEIKHKLGIDSGKNRVIADNEYFISFLPFASEFPFETWVMPKHHTADYALINPDEATQLATIIQEVFKKLNQTLPNLDYNMFLHTLTSNGDIKECYHWHFEIIPKLTKMAGFEYGSRNFINVIAPETAAKLILEKS